MAAIEIWLCRVLLEQGPPYNPLRQQDLRPDAHQRVMQKIIDGELGTLEDGSIIEPMQAFASEELANEARMKAAADDPKFGYRYRVVVSMEVPS